MLRISKNYCELNRKFKNSHSVKALSFKVEQVIFESQFTVMVNRVLEAEINFATLLMALGFWPDSKKQIILSSR